MNGTFLIFDKLTGLIKRVVTCPVIHIHYQIQAGEDFLAGAMSDHLRYVDIKTREVKDRPVLPAVVENLVLKKVPAGASIFIEEAQYQADGTDITLEFNYVGSYTIRVEAFPYQDWSTTVEITA